jgi:hypothetical protein
MNCRQGDIAVIVRSQYRPDLIGRIVEVLSLAPNGVAFRLPNGKPHAALRGTHPCWVCKFQSPVTAPCDYGLTVETLYAPVPDECLRPLRDGDGDDEMLRIAGNPNKQPEVV